MAASLAVTLPLASPSAAAPHPIQTWCANAFWVGFGDIRPSTHTEAINCVASARIANGLSATTFGPGRTVTRGQMASFIARALDVAYSLRTGDGTPLPEGGADAFADDDGSPHEANIDRLASAGIVNGTGAGRFDPSGTVTRAQMASFLTRANDFLGAIAPFDASTDHFDDDDGNAHESNINAIAEAGIASGTSARSYEPSSAVRRGSMATFLARFLAVMHADGAIAPVPDRPVVNGLIAHGGPAFIDPDYYSSLLHTVRPDGTARQRISPASRAARTSMEIHPTWSPDGHRLAFADFDRNIWIADADGSNARIVGTGEMPAWAPDGYTLAYTTPGSELWTMDIDTGATERVGPYRGASWSPDGTQILTTAQDADFNGIPRIVDRKGNTVRELDHSSAGWRADWSPDGRSLVYACQRYNPDLPTTNHYAVCSADIATGEETFLTDGLPWDSAPVWSPDGTAIAFVRDFSLGGCPDDAPDCQAGVVVMNTDGSGERTIVGGTRGDGGSADLIAGLSWQGVRP